MTPQSKFMVTLSLKSEATLSVDAPNEREAVRLAVERALRQPELVCQSDMSLGVVGVEAE